MSVRFSRFQVVAVAALAITMASMYAVLAVLPAGPAVELSSVSGLLERCDMGYCVGEGPIDFGPDWYLEQTPSEYDYNGDGEIGTLFEELSGILGEDAVIEVDPRTDRPSAYVVNGAPWLEFEATPPWAGGEPSEAVTPTTVATTTDDTTVTSASTPEPVPLTTLSGLLEPCGNGFCLGGVSLYFGPWWFLNHTVATHDYDHDGALSSPVTELETLIGIEVGIEALPDDEGLSVFNLNGFPWRPVDEAPPWIGGPDEGLITPDGDDAEEDEPEDHSESSDPGPPDDLPAPAQP